MIYMLCRNRVRNYEKWRKVFDSNASAPHEAGLSLVHLWRSLDDVHTVFFLFEVHDIERAKAFISAPEGAKTGKKAGVLEGEIHFLEEAEGY